MQNGETAQTGIKYDGKGKEVTDRQYLAFRFADSVGRWMW